MLRTTEDLPAGITYIVEASENGKTDAGMMKNVEWKEIKEVQEVAHKSPSLNVTQNTRKTLWSEGEKDLKIQPAH